MLSLKYEFNTGKLTAYESYEGEIVKKEELNISDKDEPILDNLRGDIYLFRNSVEIFPYPEIDTIEDFKKLLKID